jgi:hypothetical protein
VDNAIEGRQPWFKNPRLLIGSALVAVTLALVGAAFGIASARTDRSAPSAEPSGGLSVVMQAPRDTATPASTPGKLATLDAAALREQTSPDLSADPEADESLRLIDAEERRLDAANAREAAAFAAQMRQIEQSDRATGEHIRGADDTRATVQPALSTSNTTEAHDPA